MYFKSLSALALAMAALTLTLAACGDKVSQNTLDTDSATARSNAEYSARVWRKQVPAYAELSMISRGDSTQSRTCPQGDGWASIDLVDPATGNPKVKLKCSTTSPSIGCRTDKPEGEGSCSRNIDSPLKGIAQ
jgi:hypothetical protein